MGTVSIIHSPKTQALHLSSSLPLEGFIIVIITNKCMHTRQVIILILSSMTILLEMLSDEI